MSSNPLSGERRWATARRGGMTVLGKVAVPKPLNLPSQRLENHGLDPSVEIVPKGTLGWSRPSSSSSNAWVSSSRNADGGNTSPSHLSGRPSSGGTGTRPSTAGSDKTHEPVASAWVSNSRPSSASGTLSSTQSSSTSLRPRSAETRPNSSQLSRFAEPVSESSVAWGPGRTAERLGVKSSKDGFSLSTGDFPTLGSEKDNSAKNFETQDHGRPSSASGRISPSNDKDTRYQADTRSGMLDTWRTDVPRMEEDGVHPSSEKWHGEGQQYFNANIPPQHFDAWRGPPVNAPAGVWYRGRPPGPTFGGPGAPGGFPMEPFPYYHPQIPPPALAASQPVPPPGAGPRGHHPKNGELYRPQMPDPYARPGVPFRPGFYPGPRGPMGFEGYYGPPMGYCNNEREIPYMGMTAGPTVHNGYPGPTAPDIVSSHGRASGRGITGKTMSDHVEAGHLEGNGGPTRVPVRNHNEWDRKEEGENREYNVQPSVSYPGKSSLPMIASRKNEWGAEDNAEEDMFAKKRTRENSSCSVPYRDRYSENVNSNDVNWTNKSESTAISPPELPQAPVASETLLPATKDTALMQKIEGLNAKLRASDGQNDAPHTYNREEQRIRPQVFDQKINRNTDKVGNTAGSSDGAPIFGDFGPIPHEVIRPVTDKPNRPMSAGSRRSYHGGQDRVDHHVQGKFNNQATDGWRRRNPTSGSSDAVTSSNMGSVLDGHGHGHGAGELTENSIINPVVKVEGESATEAHDSTDTHAQRVKMRELAKQRALQLQKEEEERIKEQKAKAFAKLEELNRRSQAGEAANQKVEGTQATTDVLGEQEESNTAGEPTQSQAPITNLASETAVTAADIESNTSKAEESVQASRNLALVTPSTDVLESNASHGLARKEHTHAVDRKAPFQSTDGGTSIPKRTGYKLKRNSLLQKSTSEKPDSHSAADAQKDFTNVAAVDVMTIEAPSGDFKPGGEVNVRNSPDNVSEPSAYQRKKVSRSSKNKHKANDASAVPALTPVLSDDTGPKRVSTESGNVIAALSNLDAQESTLVEPEGLQAPEACSSLPSEESQSKVTNNWKPQHLRRAPRSQHTNRFTEKVHGSDVIWAPVRAHNKAEDSVEPNLNSNLESTNPMKTDSMAQISFKGKRAEIERYVPKPVAKELAQQGSGPHLSSSISSSKSDEVARIRQAESVSFGSLQPSSSASKFVESTLEIKEGDGRNNKQNKEHGQWRQRGDPSHTTGLHFGQFEDIQLSKEQNQLVKCENAAANAEIRTSGDVDTIDCDNLSGNATTAAGSRSTGVKDQGTTGRVKRRVTGPRRTANITDSENILTGEIDGSSVLSVATDVNQPERTVESKENRNYGERTSSHWKPKSHLNIDKVQGSETITAELKALKKDHPQRKVQVPPRPDKESGDINKPQPNQFFHESNVDEESVTGRNQGLNREKKPAPARGSPYSPNQDTVVLEEPIPTASTEGQRERNLSGSRRNVGQNSRYARGHEPHGDWSSGQGTRPHNAPSMRGRHRQSTHYEYQPVGPTKPSNPEKHDGLEEGANHGSQRYGDRGQSFKRGGNYYQRQSGAHA